MPDAICWDGKPETVERIRVSMPDCFYSYHDEILTLKSFRMTSAKRGVHDTRIVPLGWYVTRKVSGHGPYAAIISPESADA